MTSEQLAILKLHAGASAMAAWTVLPAADRIDLDLALLVYGTDLRTVAAYLLRDLAERTAPGQAGVKRVKVGSIELELLADAGVDARSTWLERAARLELAASKSLRGGNFPIVPVWTK